MTVSIPTDEALMLQDDMRRRVEQSGTSFYAAMRLLPADRRAAMYAIYAFCREVDDIADSDQPSAEKIAGLNRWREEIDQLYRGQPRHAIARALAEPVQKFQLRREDFLAVIDGMAMDAVEDIRAPSSADLDLYCDRVASAVGRLSVRAFGDTSRDADAVAYYLGRALQLTNILRDLTEDAARGRLYLPGDLLRAAGVDKTHPSAVLAEPGIADVCRKIAIQAEEYFVAAATAMTYCNRKAIRPARVMGAVYHAILRKLSARGWHDLAQPVALSKPHKIWLALRHGFF